jgi:hypothetical protein
VAAGGGGAAADLDEGFGAALVGGSGVGAVGGGRGADSGSRAAASTAAASGSSWPLIRVIPFSRGLSRSALRARRAASLRSRERSAPTRAISIRPTAMTWRW